MAAIDVGLSRKGRRNFEFEVGVREREDQVDVFAVESSKNLPNDLHVLL